LDLLDLLAVPTMRSVQMRPQSYVILPTDGAMPISFFAVGVHCSNLSLHQSQSAGRWMHLSLGFTRLLVQGNIVLPVLVPVHAYSHHSNSVIICG
jgi:hypothetical protein